MKRLILSIFLASGLCYGQQQNFPGGGSGGGGSSSVSYQSVTPATASSAISLGTGATNSNSANGGAGVASLPVTLNINVGDFVIVFTDTQDTSATLTDNGGNSYYQIGVVGSNRGKGLAWYVPYATASATQLTVSDAANAYTISAATYINVFGLGKVITPVNQNINSLSMSLTTTAANSLVVGCFQFNAASTFSPTSGTTVTSSFNNTNTVNTAMMSITTTTPGSYTLSATTNQGTAVSQGLAVELLAAGAVNQNSPILTLGGTGWNGSSSVNSVATLQTIVPQVTNPVPILTTATPFSVVNAGTFSDGTVTPYIGASVNGSNAATEFSGVGQSGPQNSAVYGGVAVPPVSSQFQSNGVFGATNTLSTTTFAVGGYFSSRALAGSTKVFGANAIAADGGFATSQIVGTEIDIEQSNADAASLTAVSNGIRVLSNGTHRPAAGIYIVGSGGTNDNFLAPLLIDDANSGDTAANRMIYLIPPDNLATTVGFQFRNHTNAADVLEMTDAGGIIPSAYGSITNCSAVGTAASPSVAACSAAPAGSFSCATNASGATCVVDTTVVTANSEIFIQQRTDTTTGTRLGVTCNTGVSSVLPVITAVTAGTSFTINLGTISSNPECFSYHIVN